MIFVFACRFASDSNNLRDGLVEVKREPVGIFADICFPSKNTGIVNRFNVWLVFEKGVVGCELLSPFSHSPPFIR